MRRRGLIRQASAPLLGAGDMDSNQIAVTASFDTLLCLSARLRHADRGPASKRGFPDA